MLYYVLGSPPHVWGQGVRGSEGVRGSKGARGARGVRVSYTMF